MKQLFYVGGPLDGTYEFRDVQAPTLKLTTHDLDDTMVGPVPSHDGEVLLVAFKTWTYRGGDRVVVVGEFPELLFDLQVMECVDVECFPKTRPCPQCGGRGGWHDTATERGDRTWIEHIQEPGFRVVWWTCPECAGSGSVEARVEDPNLVPRW